jgi:hypothetical protein
MKQEKAIARMMCVVSLLSLILFGCFASARAQTTVFTYQGCLTDSSMAANGTYEMKFALYGSPDGSDQIGATIENSNVTVTNGVFTVGLDFGATAFDGSPRFLKITVKKPGDADFTNLTPRQPVNSTPYSIRALSAATAVTSTNALSVGGTPSAQIIREGDVRLTNTRYPNAGSSNYVQNRTTQQGSTNFNIDGTGAANIFDAGTQFNIGGNRVLSVGGAENIFVGRNAGAVTTGRNDGSDNVRIFGLGAAGSTPLCRNADNEISNCSSSLRYKTSITAFGFGLNLIKRLRPISFDWKDDGMKDVGFGAEDVEAINPLFVNYNRKGEVEGVKYDRFSVLFVNALQEQQTQIEAQQKQINEQKLLIDGLKKLVCSQNPEAHLCQ